MIKKYIVSKYTEGDFIIQSKAQYLFLFCLLLSVVLTVLLFLDMIFSPDQFIKSVTSMTPIISVSLIALVLITRGRYHAAAYLFLLFGAVGILINLFTAKDGYASSMHYVPGFIVLTILFANRILASIFTGVFVCVYIAYYFMMKGAGIDQSSLSIAFNSSLSSLVLTYIVAHLIVNTLNRAIVRTGEESEKNLKLYQSTAELLQKVKEQVFTLSASSEEMSKTSESFSENAQNQAAFVEEVTGTVEEVSSVVENVSCNVSEQQNSITRLMAIIDRLSEIVRAVGERNHEALAATAGISETVKTGEKSLNMMNRSMANIIESSKEVTGIVEIITDISDKINLLSLNAAIEAARAGDAGRGFAVVADEISKLADRTATSIKEIDRLIRANDAEISSGMSNVDQSVQVMGMIIEEVTRIDSITNAAAENVKDQIAKNDELNTEAANTRARTDEIRIASEELKTVMHEISKSVTSINDLIQANASGAEEMASTSDVVKRVALSLKNEVESFSA